MFEVIWFILKCIIDFLKMLFSIDVGVCSLGVVMCVCFIFFPTIIMIVDFFKASTGDVSFALLNNNENRGRNK